MSDKTAARVAGLSYVALRSARWVGLASAELALLAIGPCLLLFADYLTFGAGVQRFVTLGVLFVFVALMSSGRLRLPSVLAVGRGRYVLAALALCAFWFAGKQFWDDASDPVECETDMGRPSVCAGELLLEGVNPWSECAPKTPRAPTLERSETMKWCLEYGPCVDYKEGGRYGRAWTHHGPGFDFMDGYKYGPLMALAYLPATHRVQEGGISGVNFGFWLALVLASVALARAAYPRLGASGMRALLVLMLPAVLPAYRVLPRHSFEALNRTFTLDPPTRAVFVRALSAMCANDVIPLCFALLACLFAVRGRSALAGIQLGLSLAAKQLPGVLFLLPLARLQGVDGRRLMLAALLTTFLFYYPFFLGGPKEMIANLVLFGFVRPTNSSSIRRFLPPGLEPLVSLAQLGLCALLITRFMRAERRDLAALFCNATLLVIGFVALNKIVHGNYLLWIQPLLAVTMAGAPFVAARDPESSSST